MNVASTQMRCLGPPDGMAHQSRSRYRAFQRSRLRGSPRIKLPARRRMIMAYAVQHVHIKTRDPKQTSQFYIDNFGATMKAEIPGRGFRLDLHGLQLNITTLIASQNHEQHMASSTSRSKPTIIRGLWPS